MPHSATKLRASQHRRPELATDSSRDESTLPLAMPRGPTIRAMSGAECEAMLDRHQVARIAYTFGSRVEILPIHFIRDGAWLYGRTSPGEKTEAWRRSRWIALEVDEVRSLFDWASVVVHGAVYALAPDGSADGAAGFEHAVGVLQRLVPGTGMPDDPVPGRTFLFRIHLDEVQGRTTAPPS